MVENILKIWLTSESDSLTEAEQFINHFHKVSPSDDITEVFTSGCCYWFAFILCKRFPNTKMMYDPIENHFAAQIGNKLYDITGDVTKYYHMIPWSLFNDELEKQRIIDYCIDFTK